MRRKQSRLGVRRLFILGAGASYSASRRPRPSTAQEAPLDKDFCKRILALDVMRPGWVNEARRRTAANWRHHQPMENSGLEEAVIRQLTHLEFIDAIHPRRRAGIKQQDWMTDVAHLICYVLDRTRENGDIYRHFVSKVYPPADPADSYRDRIVTFNYDCLLDKHLLNRFTPNRIYFDTILSDKNQSTRRPELHSDPLLIKLHGSVNWRCDLTEFSSILTDGGAGDDSPHYIERIWTSSGVPSPDDEDYPLLIPPLPKKPITRISLFRYLWTRAYEYMHEAEELVIAGYSLPEADQLAQSLFGNFGNRELKEVSIIDPNPSIIGRWQQLLRRRNVGSARWTYYDDFGEFVIRMDSPPPI